MEHLQVQTKQQKIMELTKQLDKSDHHLVVHTSHYCKGKIMKYFKNKHNMSYQYLFIKLESNE